MTKKNTEVAKTETITDISRFEGFDDMGIDMSYLILVQGNTELKDTLGAKNGDWVLDEQVLGNSVEVVPLKSERIYDVYEGELDADNKIEGEYVETLAPHQISKDDLEPAYEAKMPTVFYNKEGQLVESKIVLTLAVDGMPCKLVCRGTAKQIAAKQFRDIVLKACKANDLQDPIEGVFKFTSYERERKVKGVVKNKYVSFTGSFVRKLDDESVAAVAGFIE